MNLTCRLYPSKTTAYGLYMASLSTAHLPPTAVASEGTELAQAALTQTLPAFQVLPTEPLPHLRFPPVPSGVTVLAAPALTAPVLGATPSAVSPLAIGSVAPGMGVAAGAGLLGVAALAAWQFTTEIAQTISRLEDQIRDRPSDLSVAERLHSIFVTEHSASRAFVEQVARDLNNYYEQFDAYPPTSAVAPLIEKMELAIAMTDNLLRSGGSQFSPHQRQQLTDEFQFRQDVLEQLSLAYNQRAQIDATLPDTLSEVNVLIAQAAAGEVFVDVVGLSTDTLSFLERYGAITTDDRKNTVEFLDDTNRANADFDVLLNLREAADHSWEAVRALYPTIQELHDVLNDVLANSDGLSSRGVYEAYFSEDSLREIEAWYNAMATSEEQPDRSPFMPVVPEPRFDDVAPAAPPVDSGDRRAPVSSAEEPEPDAGESNAGESDESPVAFTDESLAEFLAELKSLLYEESIESPADPLLQDFQHQVDILAALSDPNRAYHEAIELWEQAARAGYDRLEYRLQLILKRSFLADPPNWSFPFPEIHDK